MQNYLNELPYDIIDNIFLFINKLKIILFHNFILIITDNYFDLFYNVYTITSYLCSYLKIDI